MSTDTFQPASPVQMPDPAPAPKGRTWLGTILRLALVLIVGVIIAGGISLWLATSGGLTERIAAIASEATGRQVSLGNARIGLGTPLTLHAENISVSNPAGQEGHLLTAKAAEGHLKLNWTPPWTFDPELEDVTLDAPQIDVRTSADGKSNLDFGNKSGASAGTLAWPKTAIVKNGKVSLTPAAAGAETLTFDEIGATVESDAATGKTTAKGRLSFRDEPADFDATFADLKMATAGLPTGLKLSVAGPRLKANLDGQAVLSGEPQYIGAAKLETPAVGDLVRWLDPKSTAAAGGSAASLDGNIKARGKDVALEAANVAVGDTQARIDGTLSLAGERPKLSGAVAMARIDLSSLGGAPTVTATRSASPEAADDTATVEFSVDADPAGFARQLKAIQTGQPVAATPAPEPDAGGAAPADDAADTRSLESKAEKPAWSDANFDLSKLRQMDLDIVLTGDVVDFGNIDIKAARLKTRLDNGKLAADIEDASVSGGKATGKVVLDAAAAKPSADIAFNLTGVAAEPVITQFAGKPFLSGTTDSVINIKTTGGNIDAMAHALEGTAKFKMAKGSFRGIDIKREANNFCLSELISGYIFGSKKTFQVDLNQKTGFEKLEAEYTIKNGVMKSVPGLAVGGADVEINSKGVVNVANKLLSQNLRLRVVPPPKLPSVPVLISGSWNKLSFKLDNNSVDWWAVLNAAALGCNKPHVVSSAAPQAEARGLAPDGAAETGKTEEASASAPPRPLPEGVAAAIEGVLAADGSGLSEEGKDALRALLPEAAPVAAPQPSGEPTP